MDFSLQKIRKRRQKWQSRKEILRDEKNKIKKTIKDKFMFSISVNRY